jgi:hypothetical protein
MKILAALSFIVIVGGLAYWQFGSQSTPLASAQYPQTVAGSFFSNTVIGPTGTDGSIPLSFATTKKLVFVDLKLQTRTSELAYKGRTIPLSLYKNGDYLPLVIISTPQGKTISAIRVCEPCGSFSFHIVEGKYLDCDICHTRWDLETLTGVSGGCPAYAPPKLTTALSSSDINIDLSPLGITVT